MGCVVFRLMVSLFMHYGWLLGRSRAGPFNNLVQLSSVKPNTSALGAVVNFYSLSIRHQ
jgi:hypothetical protein